MDLEKFLKHFKEQFDETDEDQIAFATKFRELDEWSSLNALAIISMLDAEYNVKASLPELEKLETVQQIADYIKSKSGALD